MLRKTVWIELPFFSLFILCYGLFYRAVTIRDGVKQAEKICMGQDGILS